MPLNSIAMQSPWLSWFSLTWFGDSSLLLPAAAVLAVALALSKGSRGLAVRWAIAFGGVGLLVLATKIAFVGWGIGSAAADFTGLSGHSALSAVFWPVAAWLVSQRRGHAVRQLCVAGGALFALAIGFSRVELSAHSPSEVASGLLVGATAAAWFLSHRRRVVPANPLVVPAAAAVVAVLVVVLHGRPAPTTPLIESLVVRALGLSAPYTRADLHLRRYRTF